MEGSDTHPNAAIIYAILSLLVRLIASQSSVFNLWFSRRCYERSRGEMITMLYEKTLSRKAIGTPTQLEKVMTPNDTNHVNPTMGPMRPRSKLKSIWGDLYGAITRLVSAADERPIDSEGPASKGKILNMMRCAPLEALLSSSQLTLRLVTTSTKCPRGTVHNLSNTLHYH